jgi:hypothetical protein
MKAVRLVKSAPSSPPPEEFLRHAKVFEGRRRVHHPGVSWAGQSLAQGRRASFLRPVVVPVGIVATLGQGAGQVARQGGPGQGRGQDQGRRHVS